MAERKTKRAENIIEVDPEEASFVLEPTKIELGAGYTLSVSYDVHDKPIVDVKTYGKIDIERVRKEIEHFFPNAQIRRLNQTGSMVVFKAKKKKDRPKRK